MPTVSIILPTYNRAKFLPQAFESIRAQQWTDWELIVVDDGSTDYTRELVEELTRDWKQPVRYIYQENQGAYGARNTGLDHARGKFIAFYDSDDLWLPHHLKNCAEALEANDDVDWVYGACRIVDDATGKELAATSFESGGEPRPFLRLQSKKRGALCVIHDKAATRCQILHGLYCGLQNSVIRRKVFSSYRFDAISRNEAEDQLIVVRALALGSVFAFFPSIHVEYRVHAENSSAVGQGPAERKLRVLSLLANGYERLLTEGSLSAADRIAVRQRLAREYFWHQGYSLLWSVGDRKRAMKMFRQGLSYWPWSITYWKTLAICLVRQRLSL